MIWLAISSGKPGPRQQDKHIQLPRRPCYQRGMEMKVRTHVPLRKRNATDGEDRVASGQKKRAAFSFISRAVACIEERIGTLDCCETVDLREKKFHNARNLNTASSKLGLFFVFIFAVLFCSISATWIAAFNFCFRRKYSQSFTNASLTYI